MNVQSINKHYVSIPVSTLQSEQWKALAPSARCVYLVMMTRYLDEGTTVAWHQEEIAEATGISLRTTVRCLDSLREAGFISDAVRGGRWQYCTAYKLESQYLNADLGAIRTLAIPDSERYKQQRRGRKSACWRLYEMAGNAVSVVLMTVCMSIILHTRIKAMNYLKI